MIDPSPAASPTDEEEYPQADGRRCKANDQKDTSNSTLVVEEPITKRNSISYCDAPRSGDLLGGACTVIGTERRIRNYLGEGRDATIAQSRGKG